MPIMEHIVIQINLRSFTFPKFMIKACIGSLCNAEACHSICLMFSISFVCIFIKGMVMPINSTFYKTINWGFIQIPNFIKFIYLESLLRVAINHPQGWVFWKPFTIQKPMGKE